MAGAGTSATNAAVMAAALVVCVFVIIAAYVTIMEVEKDIDSGRTQGSMTSVYGQNYTTLPHGSLGPLGTPRPPWGQNYAPNRVL